MSASTRTQSSHSPHPPDAQDKQHSHAPSPPPPRQSPPPPGEDEDDNRQYNMFRHSDDDDEDGGGAGNNAVGGEAAASEEGPHHIPKSPEYAACAAAATAAAKKAMSTATTEVKVGGVSFAPPTIQSSTRRWTRGSAMKQTNDDDYVEEERNHNDHQNVVDRHHSGYNNEEVDAEHALLQLATAPSWGSIIDIQKVETFDAQEDSSRSGSSSRAHSVNSNVITPASLPRKSTSYDANFIYPPSSPIKSTRTEDEDVRSSPVVEDDDEYDNDEEHPGGEEWMPPPSNFTRGRPLGGGGYYDGGSLNTLHIPPPPPHVRPQFIRPGGSSYAASYGHPRLVDSSSRDSNESSTYASGRIQAVGRQDEWDAHAHYQQHQQPWSIVSHSRSDEQQQGGSNEWDPPRPTRKPMVPPGGYPTYHYHPSHPHHPSYPPHHADYCSGIKRSSSTSGTVGGGGVYPPGGPPPRGGGGDGSLYPPMHYQHGYPHTTHHSGYSLGVYDGGPYRSSHPNSALPPHYPPPQGMGFAGGIKEEVDDDYYGVAHTSSSSLNNANNDVEMKAPRPQFQNVKRGKPASSAASGGAGGGTMKQHTGVDTIEGGIMSHLYQKKGRVYDVMTGEAITTPARTKQPIRRRRRNPTEKAAAAAAMAAAAAAAMRERNAAKQTAGSLSVDKNKENNSVDMEDRDNDGRMVEGGDLVPSPFSEEELKTLGSGDDEDIPAAKRAAMASALALRAAAGGSPVEPPKSAAEVDFDIADPPLGPVMPPSDIAAIDSAALMSENDVLCGRGGGTNSQMGNRRFRALVRDFQPTYLMAKRREKPKMARSVVLIVRNRGGRFLRRDDTDGRLYEVGDEKAEAKTSQALREGLDVRATKTAANTLMGTTAIETTIRKRKSFSPIENENYSVKRPVRPQPVHAPGYTRGPPQPGPPIGYYSPYQPRYDDPYYHGRCPPPQPPPGAVGPGSYDYRAPPPPSAGSSFGYHYPANYHPGYADHPPPSSQGGGTMYPSSPPRSSCEAMSTSSPTPKTDAFSPPRNTGINKHPQRMHQQLTSSESQDNIYLNED